MPDPEPFNSRERTALDTNASAAVASQRDSNELLVQLQRLQVLQQEAQSLFN